LDGSTEDSGHTTHASESSDAYRSFYEVIGSPSYFFQIMVSDFTSFKVDLNHSKCYCKTTEDETSEISHCLLGEDEFQIACKELIKISDLVAGDATHFDASLFAISNKSLNHEDSLENIPFQEQVRLFDKILGEKKLIMVIR